MSLPATKRAEIQDGGRRRKSVSSYDLAIGSNNFTWFIGFFFVCVCVCLFIGHLTDSAAQFYTIFKLTACLKRRAAVVPN